ncbi:Uncharacterised protein [Neisseria meningitidis]|nr:Uncharacterised protein [Neisseria meningitidis]CWR27116.1 Uncharacterised protein [Neisseria meningitidis]
MCRLIGNFIHQYDFQRFGFAVDGLDEGLEMRAGVMFVNSCLRFPIFHENKTVRFADFLMEIVADVALFCTAGFDQFFKLCCQCFCVFRFDGNQCDNFNVRNKSLLPFVFQTTFKYRAV